MKHVDTSFAFTSSTLELVFASARSIAITLKSFGRNALRYANVMSCS